MDNTLSCLQESKEPHTPSFKKNPHTKILNHLKDGGGGGEILIPNGILQSKLTLQVVGEMWA